MTEYIIYCPLGKFVQALAEGWNLPFVVEPMQRPHGTYAVLMWRAGE